MSGTPLECYREHGVTDLSRNSVEEERVFIRYSLLQGSRVAGNGVVNPVLIFGAEQSPYRMRIALPFLR